MHERLTPLFQRLKKQRTENEPEPSEQVESPLWANPTAPLVVITTLAIAVGLVFGIIGVALWSRNQPPAPPANLVSLDPASQDDYIIAVAEAYYLDQDIRLAHDRLARLDSEQLDKRVQALASSYAAQHDVVSSRLAGLAVALGSQNPVLVQIYLESQPARIAALSEDLGGVPLLPPVEAPLPSPVTPGSPPTTAPSVAPKTPGAANPPPQPALTAAAGGPTVVDPNGAPSTTSNPSGGSNSATPEDETSAQPSSGTQSKPTNTPLPKPKVAAAAPAPFKNPIIARLPVNVPDYVGAPSTSIPLTARPGRCTPAAQMPPVVDHTILLCSGQQYAPFRVKGENITIYGDRDGTAVIQAPPHTFGITATGNNIAIIGVHIAPATDPGDLNSWLCLYDGCGYKGAPPHGALGYGGGILLDNATNSGVSGVVVGSGTTGIAISHGTNNRLIDNNLSELNGWGILLLYTDSIDLVNNTTNHVNRACNDPDGNYLQSGCESSGIAAIQANNSVFFKNHCERSGNCIYASGVGGYGSNNNQFFNNYCAGASANCYEVTFSQGNRFDYNVATTATDTGDVCVYPFWVGGSIVKFGSHNNWNCKFSASFSLKESQKDVNAPTNIEGF